MQWVRGANVTYSQIANIIRGMIKGQDMLILAVLMGEGASRLPYSELGRIACLSVSEAHAAVKRLQDSMLINSSRNLLKRNVEEFLFHGFRYAFPMRPLGKNIKGMPTSYAAPVALGEFASAGPVPVWNGSEGTVDGRAFEPIYPSASKAAANDRRFQFRGTHYPRSVLDCGIEISLHDSFLSVIDTELSVVVFIIVEFAHLVKTEATDF